MSIRFEFGRGKTWAIDDSNEKMGYCYFRPGVTYGWRAVTRCNSKAQSFLTETEARQWLIERITANAAPQK